jgi:hypothetical protein
MTIDIGLFAQAVIVLVIVFAVKTISEAKKK